MTGRSAPLGRFGAALLIALALPATISALTRADDAAGTEGEAKADTPTESTVRNELFRGQVVLLPEALRELDLRVAEEMHAQVVLKTTDGELIPILADWRGRAFYQDQRLRNRDVELVGFRRPGLPYLQVLMIFTFNEAGERQYTDYWCDVCSIPMYEIKPCECCQGEIRLRSQKQNLPDYLSPDADRLPQHRPPQ